MAVIYDFVVVGSGPAGCSVAVGLASSAKRPKVLLLEAGGLNDDRNMRVDGQRWLTFQNKNMNWGYKTAPQTYCNNREIDYARGKGLGGSSAVNFGVFSIGARDDFDEWARVVDDDFFRWEKMQARLKNLETFHREIPAGIDERYAAPRASDHGSSGPLHVGFAAEWERDLPHMLDIFENAGFPLNPDHNSGDPLGMSVVINSAYKGLRSTAADLLKARPENLTVLTDSPVQRVILEGKKAVGVESNGEKYLASKEVILSAGSLDSPKILMHSGIGPGEQLQKYNIPIKHVVPAVGQGLRDHYFATLVYARTEDSSDRGAFYNDQSAMDAALKLWKETGTGPWAKFACEMGIGYFKLDNLVSSKAFKDLPEDEQSYLLKETVPHYEVLTHFPIHWFMPPSPDSPYNLASLNVFLYNSQARGEVTLQSSDPDVPLVFDPKFLSHPYDRRVAIDSVRDVFKVARHPDFTKDTVAELATPKSDSDEDILEFWRQNVSSSWHPTCTIKMGRPGDPEAAVDKDFRLMGIENLRVADMSVVPVLPSGHTQAVAYLTGLTCAEKLVQEYDLA